MTVARILVSKGGDIVTAQPHRTMAEAAKLMADKAIGALIVVEPNGAPLGVISERDIVHAIARDGAQALNEAVTRYMIKNIATTTRYATVGEVMGHMTRGRFRHMPVVEDDRLVGIVSIGDVVKRHIEEIDTERQAMRDYIASV